MLMPAVGRAGGGVEMGTGGRKSWMPLEPEFFPPVEAKWCHMQGIF